jgi:hypothetical protein
MLPVLRKMILMKLFLLEDHLEFQRYNSLFGNSLIIESFMVELILMRPSVKGQLF